MRLRNTKPRYGLYGANAYMLSLALIFLLGIAIAVLGFNKGARGFFLMGLIVIFYGAASTIGWFLARYVIPGRPVTVARKAIETLNLNGTEVVLDVGTGRGLFAIEIAKRLIAGTVIAIDVWEPEKIDKGIHHHKWARPMGNTIRNARLNAELEGVHKKVKFENMNANDLDFSPNTFDLVICGYVLGHLGHHASNVLEKIHEVLKTDGRLLIIDNARDFTFFVMSTPHLFLLSYLRGKKARNLTERYWLSIIAKTGFSIKRLSKGKGIILLEVEPFVIRGDILKG